MPKQMFYTLVAFCFVLLVSCGRTGSYRTSKLNISSTDFDKTYKEALLSDSFVQGEWHDQNWWSQFNDPELTRLIGHALACNPTMEMTETRIYLATEQAKYVRANLLPNIDFDANVMRRRVGEFSAIFLPGLVDLFTETTIKSFNASYELDLWKKNRHLFWAELDLVQAQMAERVEAALVLGTAVGKSYFDFQIAHKRRDIVLEMLKKKRQLLMLLKERFDHGVISEFHLYKTDQQVAALQDSVEILTNEIEVSRNSINALVGNACTVCCEGGQLTHVGSAKTSAPFPLPACLPLDLIARRPEITAQKWRIEGACHQIKAAKASFYPNVNLLAFFGFQSIEASKLLQAQSYNIMGRGAIHLPIFDGGILRANLGTAKESFELAIQEYNQLILHAVQEVSDWVSALKTADKRQKAIDRSLADADALLYLTTLRFENGVEDLVSVLNSEIDCLMQKDLSAQITLARLQATLGLIKALGGGFHECS